MNFKELNRVWIIAEIGLNHEGDVHLASDMIRMASDAGADAVKFQTYRADALISCIEKARYERIKNFELTYDDFYHLSRIAGENGVVFFTTPLDIQSVDAVSDYVTIFKVASGDLNNLHLIRHIASKGKPVILSTGFGSKDEIQSAIDTVLKVQPDLGTEGRLLINHCVASYPTPASEANLAMIGRLKEDFELPVGYSDHTLGIKACEIAVACGAIAIEKHFTYRKENQMFHDHAISMDPKDLEELRANVDAAQELVGTDTKFKVPSEEKLIGVFRRGLAVVCDVSKGTPLREEWLIAIRPAGEALSADKYDWVIGRKLSRDLSRGEFVYEKDIVAEV